MSLSQPLHFTVHAPHTPTSVFISFTSKVDIFCLLIQPPVVRFWMQFLLHPSHVSLTCLGGRCAPAPFLPPPLGLQPCIAAPMLKTSQYSSRISRSREKVAPRRSAFVPPSICGFSSVEGINDLRWDLPSTARTSCNTAFALVLSDVGVIHCSPQPGVPGHLDA